MKGLLINKFRGDASLLTSGIEILEKKGGIPVAGVIPYMEIDLEDEDSLTDRFVKKKQGKIDIVVIRYPRISNFTDFNVFEQIRKCRCATSHLRQNLNARIWSFCLAAKTRQAI